jgi:hypothetical protein
MLLQFYASNTSKTFEYYTNETRTIYFKLFRVGKFTFNL